MIFLVFGVYSKARGEKLNSEVKKVPYKWIQAVVHGEIDSNGNIIATIAQKVGMNTPRPRERFEDSGADWETFDRLRNRIPGEFKTPAYMGGATSILVRTKSLKWLPEDLMAKLRVKYGPLGESTLIAMVRNTGAPTIWNVAEPSGGMAEDFNLRAEQIGETVEVGVYRRDGWLRFVLEDILSDFQTKIDQEQSLWWAVAKPGLPQKYEAKIRFLPYGLDSLDGQQVFLVAGPVGDLQILSIAQLALPGSGWLLQDLEARPDLDDKDETIWLSLNRKVVGITPREGRSPMLYEFAKEGGLDHCGLHLALSGEALEYNISHLIRPTLKILGWI